MATKRLKYQGFGTINGVKRVLWQILQQCSAAIHDPAMTDEAKRGWANTAIQGALAYCKVHEGQELTAQVKELERYAGRNGRVA